MRESDEQLLAVFGKKTKDGYPLGEVREDLLGLGYTEDEAAVFMTSLGEKINRKVAYREKRLRATVALLLMAGGIVLYIFGFAKGIGFIIAGSIWLTIDLLIQKRDSKDHG
jgi:hypothetical protein